MAETRRTRIGTGRGKKRKRKRKLIENGKRNTKK